MQRIQHPANGNEVYSCVPGMRNFGISEFQLCLKSRFGGKEFRA